MRTLKLNKKGLLQKGGTPAPKMSMDTDTILQGIKEKLEGGISETEIFLNLVDQAIPLDEIQAAFMALGYDESMLSSIMENAKQEETQAIEEEPIEGASLPVAQRGFFGNPMFRGTISTGNIDPNSDYRPARGTYLQQDLFNQGNFAGALGVFAEGVNKLFSKKDNDGDGLMDGSFMDSRAKRLRHKDNAGGYYDYKITFDKNDPNKDNYALNYRDLFNNNLRTNEQYITDVNDNSQLNFNTDTGQYDFMLSADKINPDIYSKNKSLPINKDSVESFLNDSKSLSNFGEVLKNNPAHENLLLQDQGFISSSLPYGSSYGVDASGSVATYSGANPYLYDTMMANNIYVGSQIPKKQGGGDSETKKERKERIKNFSHPYLEQYSNLFNTLGKNKNQAIDIMSQLNLTGNDTLFMGISPFISEAKMMTDENLANYIASLKDPKAYQDGEGVIVNYNDKAKVKELDEKTYMTGDNNNMFLNIMKAVKAKSSDFTPKYQLAGEFDPEEDTGMTTGPALTPTVEEGVIPSGMTTGTDNYLDEVIVNAPGGNNNSMPINSLTTNSMPTSSNFFNNNNNNNNNQGFNLFNNPSGTAPFANNDFSDIGNDSNLITEPGQLTANIVNNQTLPAGDGSGNLTDDGTATTQIEDFSVISDANTTVPLGDDGSFDDPSIKRKNKIAGGIQRFLDSPLAQKIGDTSGLIVAGANVVNEFFKDRNKNRALNEITNKRTADDIYGMQLDGADGSRGLFDEKTGLAQPDNMIAYEARMGRETFMMPPMKEQENIVDLDYKTIAKLIASGANIEIL